MSLMTLHSAFSAGWQMVRLRLTRKKAVAGWERTIFCGTQELIIARPEVSISLIVSSDISDSAEATAKSRPIGGSTTSRDLTSSSTIPARPAGQLNDSKLFQHRFSQAFSSVHNNDDRGDSTHLTKATDFSPNFPSHPSKYFLTLPSSVGTFGLFITLGITSSELLPTSPYPTEVAP